ncbi:MAG: nucleoside deaminase [Acidobacteria bacterium]|nr:nucleoside deaminase [Acidobacteriota bacterium]
MDPFLAEALREARASFAQGGIPIGSVLVRGGQILGRGHNKRVQENDPVTHAEIDCLRNAGRVRNFAGTVLYSTLMPCYLCAGAVVQFGIPRVVAGESRTFPGAQDWLRQCGVEVMDLDSDECYQLLQEFVRKYPQVWDEDIGR